VNLRLGVSVPVTRVAFDPRFDRLVPDGTPITPHADGAIWAEGPVYIPDEDAVLWSDVRSNAVRRWSDADGDSVLFQPSDFANGHTLDHDGTVLACEHGRRRVSRYERDGTRSTGSGLGGSTRRTTSSSPPTVRSGSPIRRTGSSTTRRATRPTPSRTAVSSTAWTEPRAR
jgi:gluconolactonase